MKTSRLSSSLAFAAAMAFALALPAKAVLVINGGFETGDLTGWTTSGDWTDTWLTSPGHSGSYAMSFGSIDGFANLAQDISTLPGGEYTLDFWAKTDGDGTLRAYWNGGLVFDSSALSGVWTEYTITGLSATGTSTTLQFSGINPPNWHQLDDIFVSETGASVPDSCLSASLLGIGLLALAALRRKLR